MLLKQNVLLYFSNSMLAEKLNMTPDEAERWIVNLIRNARLDAKIDSKLVCVFCAVIFVNLVKRLYFNFSNHVNYTSVFLFFLNSFF